MSPRHHCHAEGCPVAVPPAMLMCLKHWRMVPATIKRRIGQTYRKGQEVDKRPSAAYMAAQNLARAAVARKEGRAEVADRLEATAKVWDERARQSAGGDATPGPPQLSLELGPERRR